MKIFFVSLFLIAQAVCLADEPRLRMVEDPNADSQSDAEDLANSLTDSFNSKNINGFVQLFAKSRASKVKSVMGPILASNDIQMRVLEVDLTSSEKERMEFVLVYSWDNATHRRVVTSDIIAKLENGKWKVESENTVAVKNTSKSDPEPAELNFGGGGQVVMKRGADDFLPSDVARSNRPDCSNGKCNLR
jgi:hypothetical protein